MKCATCPLADDPIPCFHEASPAACARASSPGVAREMARWNSLYAAGKIKATPTPRVELAPSPFAVGPGEGRIRVALIAPVCHAAGAEHWMLALAMALDPSRFVVVGLAIHLGRGSGDPAMIARFEARTPVGYGRAAALDLAAQADVVVAWDAYDLPARIAERPGSPPVVLVGHSPPQSDWGLHSMSEASLAGVRSIVCVSELAVATVAAPRRAEARVIWNAVDAGRFEPTRDRASVRAGWGVPASAKVAGFLGRLSSEKRPDVLPSLARSLPEGWHAVAVGGGPMLESIRAASASVENLHMVGPDPDAGSVLGAFDWLISPSEFESFGLSMAEAMGSGVPVISTPTGLPAIAPGLARMVGPMASGEALAAAILADAADPSGTKARVDFARSFARERLSLARFGREWGDHLAGLVVPPAPRPRVAGLGDADLARIVATCPDRGSVLPVSMQREGCRCGELSECRNGKGTIPGRVSLKDCLACVKSRRDDPI